MLEVVKGAVRRLKGLGTSKQHDAPFYKQPDSCQIPDLWFLLSRFLGERHDGCFVEVGAFDGVFASNTWGLAQRGWRGLMVEPVPDFAARCRSNMRPFRSVEVVEAVVSDSVGESVQIHVGGPLTTVEDAMLDMYRQTNWALPSLTESRLSAESVTLDHLLASRDWRPDFDLLVVDVEGHEVRVFEGFSITHWQPKMLIVELADTHPDLVGQSREHASLSTRISSSGYVIVFKDRVNTVFVRSDVLDTALNV